MAKYIEAVETEDEATRAEVMDQILAYQPRPGGAVRANGPVIGGGTEKLWEWVVPTCLRVLNLALTAG